MSLLLTACTSAGPKGPEPIPFEPSVVTVDARGATLVAIRDADDEAAPWQRQTLDADGTATFETEGRYAILTVCERESREVYARYGAGSATVAQRCTVDGAERVPVTFRVPGGEDVRIHAGFFSRSGEGVLDVSKGLRDIVVTDTRAADPRFLILRDVEIAGPTEIVLDLTQAQPLRATSVFVDEMDPDLFFSTTLQTRNGTRVLTLAEDAGEVPMFPSAALLPGETQKLTADLTGDLVSRWAEVDLVGDPTVTTVSLPLTIGEVRPVWQGGITVAYPTDRVFSELYFSATTEATTWTLDTDVSFGEAGPMPQPLVLPDPATIPGWQPAWTVADPTGFAWSFLVTQGTGRYVMREGVF